MEIVIRMRTGLDPKNTASLRNLPNYCQWAVVALNNASDTDHIGNHLQESVFSSLHQL